MKLKKRLLSSSIVSVAYLVSSIFLSTIPCRTAPNVPNPTYSWALCSITNNSTTALNSLKEYWGYTTNLSAAITISLVLGFVIPFTILHYLGRRGRKRE